MYKINAQEAFTNPLIKNFGVPNLIKFEDIDVGDEEHSVIMQTESVPSIDIFWQLYEHRCPECGNALTDYDNYTFTKLNGECLGCNHVRGEIDAMKMLEAKDQMAEYMMSFGEYGEGL